MGGNRAEWEQGRVFARLLRIAIEGPELGDVNFEDILEVFKENITVRTVQVNHYYPCCLPSVHVSVLVISLK